MLSNKIKKSKANNLKLESNIYKSWTLSNRQLCDLEMILNNSFSPLSNFLNKSNYDSVLHNMRLETGELWPIPINLDITSKFQNKIKDSDKITLKDKEGFPVAILKISDIWEPNLKNEAELIYNTKNIEHPGVNYLLNRVNKIYISGDILKIADIRHHDYAYLRHTPFQLKSIFKKNNWEKIVAFQTRNPLHRAHVEMMKKTIKNLGAKVIASSLLLE